MRPIYVYRGTSGIPGKGDSLSRVGSCRWQPVLETVLVFGVFALSAGWPIPDVNESHYLVKARHYWNPDWLSGDFFLAQSEEHQAIPWVETHFVFYAATGWVARFLSLYWYAWLGRALTWLALAWSWRRLSFALVPWRWMAPLSAALFVLFNERFQMAGEWVVGGFEAKGFAYALVWLALEAMARARWTWACVCAGLASAVHVLVGGWAAVVLLVTWLGDVDGRPSLKQFAGGACLALALALPGIIPAVVIDWGTPAATLKEAGEIYVYQRLRHHLLPQFFPAVAVARFTMLFVLWLLVAWHGKVTPGQRRLRRFVLLSVGVGAVGIGLSWIFWAYPAWEAQIMRYYWFRLADMALPLGAALAWPALATNRLAEGAKTAARRALLLGPLVALAACYLTLQGRAVLTADRPRSDAPNKVLDHNAWREAAAWARANTPSDALFLTPRTSQTFKWYAARGEVATWKDVPQNARGVVAWWDRLVDMYGRDSQTSSWRHDSLTELSPERLEELGRKYGARYVVTEAEPPLPLPRVYTNSVYAIYRLNEPTESRLNRNIFP
jgi:hypothetical protein